MPATFCLLHGNWHGPSCWGPLTEELEARGHRCLAPELPLDDPNATHLDRARPALDSVAGADAPVVVVGHSLAAGVGPVVATYADVALVVHLCPAPTGLFAGVDVGVRPVRRAFDLPPADERGVSVWDPDAAIEAMYARVPPVVARAASTGLRPGSFAPDPYPLDAHPAVPGRVIVATFDEFFDPEWARRVARAVLGTEPVELATGHFPMLEAPVELAASLDELTG